MYDSVSTSRDDEDPLVAYKRIDITTFACRLGYTECLDRSLKLFNEWMSMRDPDTFNK